MYRVEFSFIDGENIKYYSPFERYSGNFLNNY